jgi:general secretion pathway protein G
MINRFRTQLVRSAEEQDGLTLIELLVVITILGILAGIVVFSVAGTGDKGQVAACKTDTATIRTAEEAYYAKNSAYTTVAALQAGGFLSNGSSLHTVTVGTGTTPSYTISTVAGAAPDTVNKCGGALAGAAVDGSTVF